MDESTFITKLFLNLIVVESLGWNPALNSEAEGEGKVYTEGATGENCQGNAGLSNPSGTDESN